MSTNARMSGRTLLRWILVAATAAAGCGTEPPIDEAELAAGSAYKASIKGGILTLTGSSAGTRLALRLQTSAILAVDVGDDGSADFTFDRSRFTQIVINAGGGDDLVRMDETSGAFTTEEQITINGGTGNDTLIGGIGAETFFGGTGNDSVTAGRGNDVVFLGDGDDTLTWNPGDGSDVLEGDGGSDALVFNGANVSEQIDLSASGTRLRFTRDIAAVAMDVDGVERVDFIARGGADTVVVHALAATAVERVNVDLAAVAGSGTGDGAADVVTLDEPGSMVAGPEGAAVVARGAGAAVGVTGGDPSLDRLLVKGAPVVVDGSAAADTMSAFDAGAGGVGVQSTGFNVSVVAGATAGVAIHGLGGDDTIAGGGFATPIALEIDGGDGNDTIVGSNGPDLLIGGPGNDSIDGAFGIDTVLLGDGDDTAVWNPGGGNDVVDGEAGSDTLSFNGANVSEQIGLLPSGDHLRLTRDIAAIALDVAGVERVDFHARGGADTVAVADLAGTTVAQVNVDLAALPGDVAGDGAADIIHVNASPGATIDVAADGAAVVATGLAQEVRVTAGEPGLDELVVNGAAAAAVDGSAAADSMVVASDGAGRTGVSAAGFGVFVAASGTGQLAVNGGGGDDTIQCPGILPALPLRIDGGDGNDTITGSAGPDVLLGGPGNDAIDGGQGIDSIFLGDGDDTSIWNPGGGNDVVDGEGGADTLLFNGSNIGEDIGMSAIGGRLHLTRNIAAIAMDVAGVERVDFIARGGADIVRVSDLTGTPVTQVNVDLAGIAGTTAGDAALDQVLVFGTAAADAFAVTADAGAVSVSGLAATVRVAHPDATDQLVVEGLGGVDTFATGPGVDGLLLLQLIQD